MKTKLGLVFLCTFLSLGAVSGANAPAPAAVHYEVKLQSSAFGDCGVRKMWIKGNNMRWEGKSQRLPLCVIRNSEGTFLIHPWNKIAGKYPKGSKRGNPKAIFPGPAGSLKIFLKAVNAKKRGVETSYEQKCTVYDFVDPQSKRQCKIWIGIKSGKPVKLVMKGERGKSDTITAQYTKFELEPKVSDALFEVPKEYTIRSMPTRGESTEAKVKTKEKSG